MVLDKSKTLLATENKKTYQIGLDNENSHDTIKKTTRNADTLKSRKRVMTPHEKVVRERM